MKRRVAAILVIAAGLIGPAVAAVPASAGSGTSSVGCSTGDSCTVMLAKMITFGGDTAGSVVNTVVNIQPPPCLWEPIGDAVTGSQSITSQFGTDPKNATTAYQVNQSVQQANDLLKQKPPPAGEWYMLPVNPAAGAAGAAACAKLPLFAWVPPGATPPGITVPPQTLAQLAAATVLLPTAGGLTFSPANGRSFTNLPTFVRATLGGRYHAGPGGRPYVSVTATLNGTSVTVWAEASRLQISASGGQSYTPDTTSCGYLGSDWMATRPQQVAQTGVGGPIDCGLTFHSPTTWRVSATMAWQTCWAQNGAANQPPNPATCTPVPGAQLNGTTWAPQAVVVNEIQSVNGSPAG
ncbi:MAG TPA: hypothetical protein VGN41_17925 [Streptosporangiaceae bacterium]